jgi:DNA polymerase-3 subunit alpha (Gram-positive type)
MGQDLKDATYVFFDLETTGISPLVDQIIEFGAVKVKNNNIIEKKQLFIKPTIPIPEQTTKLTNITNEDVADAPSLEEAIDEILDFMGDAILVAHNADFDMTFMNAHLNYLGRERLTNTVIDTLKLS